VKKKDTRGRKMRSDNVRVVPEFREQIDIDKLCQALIEIAKSLATDTNTDITVPQDTDTNHSGEG
jgi:hypothetical protein